MIEKVNVIAYFAPTARRRYFRLASAIRAETIARIKEKHPTEAREFGENGFMTYGGYHWSYIDRHKVLYRRYHRIIKRHAMLAEREK